MKIEAPWAKVPLHVAADESLTLGDLRAYIAIDYLAGKRGWWYGPQSEIAELMGVHENTVQRAVQALRDAGHISTVRLGLSQKRVTRYYVHARTLDTDVDTIRGVTETPSEVSTETTADGGSNTTDLPQTESIETTTTSRVFFKDVMKRDPPNRTVREMLLNIDAAHPPECVRWAWEKAATANEPWTYVQRIFNGCILGGEGHGPRRSNGQKPIQRGARAAVRTANGTDSDPW